MKNWWPISQAYLGLKTPKYPLAFHTQNGIRILLDDYFEVVTAWVVFCRDEYVIPTNSKTVLDIGANFGAFSMRAATVALDARIISLEPFPKTFQQLEKNILTNQLASRVECWPLAVAAASGVRQMSLSPAIKSHSKELLNDVAENEETICVDTLSLEELIQRAHRHFNSDQIDLVKMDIEGAEHEILPNVDPCVLAGVKSWQMEYHPRQPKSKLFEGLERAGLCCINDVRLGADYGVAHFIRN